jgi:carbon storage regulator
MLLVTRNKDQIIRIDDDIVIRVCDIKNNQVRIGIEAPREILIHRDEIYQKIKKAG